MKTNKQKSAEKREKHKADYKTMARFIKAVINILERTGLHADIKEQLTSTYNNFKLRGNK